MITLWLVELFANELAILRNNKQEYALLHNSFKQFLMRPVIQVNIYLLYFIVHRYIDITTIINNKRIGLQLCILIFC